MAEIGVKSVEDLLIPIFFLGDDVESFTFLIFLLSLSTFSIRFNSFFNCELIKLVVLVIKGFSFSSSFSLSLIGFEFVCLSSGLSKRFCNKRISSKSVDFFGLMNNKKIKLYKLI
jgi:hypothetical protein